MELNLNLQYPRNDKYKFITKLERINLDEEMQKDIASGKGFLIKEPQDIRKTLKSDDSIYSRKFLATLQDPDAFMDRYSCTCGATKGRGKRNIICPTCGTKVKFVGDDFEIFGWIVLKDAYHIIHPNLYKSLAAYFSVTTLEAIIEPEIELDENGKPVSLYDKRLTKKKTKRSFSRRKTKVDHTFEGIGMLEFYNRFDEILEYFHQKNKQKKIEYYNDIIENRDKIFTHSIPVYSTGLRPFKTEGKRFTFEGTNAIFNIMAKLAANINKDELLIHRNAKYRNSLLWDLQERYNRLYVEIEAILANKKGSIRMLIGGRCGFTSRLVIIPGPELEIDHCIMSYYSLVELLQQTIINILAKTYAMSYADAYMQWFKSQITVDERIAQIIQNLIDTSGGIDVIVNRNPSIAYGSLMAMKCIGMSYDYVLILPLSILSTMGADFDGDCLNILYIPNKAFWLEARKVFSPRNMMISNNDGRLNQSMNVFKDVLININGLLRLARPNYSKAQLAAIEKVKAKWGNTKI